jgi:hypothetical protein
MAPGPRVPVWERMLANYGAAVEATGRLLYGAAYEGPRFQKIGKFL